MGFGNELSQVVISLMVGVPYRAFDVNDLMLNTVGDIIAWLGNRSLARITKWRNCYSPTEPIPSPNLRVCDAEYIERPRRRNPRNLSPRQPSS